MNNILDKINKEAKNITENEISEWVVPSLLGHFSNKINSYSYLLYGRSDVAKRAFIEKSSIGLTRAVKTFVIDKEYWKNGRDIEPYLFSVLKNIYIAERYINKNGLTKAPICPACSFFGRREYCLLLNKNVICDICEREYNRLSESKELSSLDKKKIHLCGIFAKHSIKGYGCPECKRFIPDSYIKDITVTCPYYDCIWFGKRYELKNKIHPKNILDVTFTDNDGISSSEYSKSNGVMSDVLANIEIKQQTEYEFNLLKNIINTQASRLSLQAPEKNIKKRLMYQAFLNILERQPDDMIRYLAHQKPGGEIPIQSQIFQEFIKLVENNLPFDIIKSGKKIEIFSLLDNDLDLFLGRSEFENTVNNDNIVSNNTKERYIGGRERRDFGPCFIGYLCDIINENGESLLNRVEYYTFAYIKLRNVSPGTKVTVKHFRIPSHYELSGLVFLQRVRKKIVLSINKRIEK